MQKNPNQICSLASEFDNTRQIQITHHPHQSSELIPLKARNLLF